ncbi:hypothetical protein [Stenotrophomonas tumulicola]|uniref:Transmembrane protein n=1 Tax=Stenotrophomonas tumulicola TaxID=1685415 RepID=A0A7W3FLB5_9GAMM|nr:hypothetical protein [Stenotrophomonas tumulicola]MBA8681540.1 hypothetical protein [Stenotrophomonas tumulicola]
MRPFPPATAAHRNAPDARLLRAVRQLALAGLAVVLVWPAARGHSEWLGWLPLWLLGMPLAAWWSLLRFPFPRLHRRRVQARRRRPRAVLTPAARVARTRAA